MEVNELKEVALNILSLDGYENVYVYLNGERINICDINSRIDNGFIDIFITAIPKNTK